MGYGQLTVDSSVNATDGVQNILMGGGVEAANIVFSGNEETQIGSFQCNGCGLGLVSGLILGTGAVTGAIGPNQDGGFESGPPTGIDGFSDPDLAVLADNTINNAAILEFDFVPTGDEIAFNFVFSSEEYPEFVNSVNDAFGFFISGPGISGPFTNNAANIALIPNTNNPVTINTVNPGVNSNYYIANHNPDDSPANFYNVQADAFTTVLTAMSQVQCGETYHIKIAIGDASDGSWDSWVYLEEGSFSSAPLELGFVQPTLAPGVENGMYEDCGQAELTFFRPPCTFGDYVFDITYSGSVMNGVDMAMLPASITIPEDEDTYVLILDPINDNEVESVENLVFFTQLETAEGEIIDIEFELLIYDHPGLALAITADSNMVCPDVPVNLTATATNAIGGENFLWSTSQTSPSIVVSSPETATYNVILTDGCGYSVTADHIVDVLPFEEPLSVPDSASHLCTGIVSGPLIHGGIPPYSIVYNDTILDIIDLTSFFSNATYQVTAVTVTDVCGNTASFTLDIYPCDTTIPNIFTPNNDTENGRFQISGIESFPGSSLMVYNRWGNLVYESPSYRNEWSGEEQEDGNYFYIFKRSDGKEYSGYVMLVR